ncbi:PstS family phosphate ABC transporter substrate-binding protein [Parapedobacter koreensis]|uniref:Phosphate ABC transporter substrate-binding protein, PhoT family n=1 Tax=Parapedobacter koreensis TaxID=332977 RepID=A0A1H7QVW5_9SPHI|nr:substrate-binding domain-containing protein [Parapedobacter koreensis]SEL51765.1 phosphate ABC transporter substrate-binding protein, PhoT family [Parapedobacter koreensis]
MKKFVLLPLISCILALLWACGGRQSDEKRTIVSGRLQVLTDETLLPIMEEQVAVFEHLYDRTEVALASAQENQIVSKLLNKEVEVVVLTRLLTEEENAFFKARKFAPRIYKFATDAVTFVVNKQVSDSTITVDRITEIMKGNAGDGPLNRLVFDNPNSSTVRLLKELAGVDTLPATGVYALKSNADVLKYVYETPQSVGVVGINWVVRPDSSTRKYVEGIKVLAVKGQEGKIGSGGYYKPSQTNLADSLYALARPVYIINAEPRKSLGMGFAAFLTGESGQRVILKSGLMPDSVPPRELIIR